MKKPMGYTPSHAKQAWLGFFMLILGIILNKAWLPDSPLLLILVLITLWHVFILGKIMVYSLFLWYKG